MPSKETLEITTMTYRADTGQLTSIGWTDNWNTGTLTPVGSLLYSYSSTQNNGQITQVDDRISKETIVYQYDSLKRLISATSTPDSGSSVTPWTQTYSYDGFGNLTGRIQNGSSYPISIDSTTNRVSGAGYDLNGNLTQGGTITYDVSNRMLSYAVSVGGATDWYGYSPDNKRIYHRKSSGAEEWTFYGAQGENLGVWAFGTRWDEPSQTYVTDFHAMASNVYFAGRLISDGNQVCSGSNCTRAVFQDREGTNRASGARYYPYGDEIGGFTATSNDREKYGTYIRDSFSGLDYADQRYYASAYGRFNTADPLNGSAVAKDPTSWNRYAYVGGDPINHLDRRGLCVEDLSTGWSYNTYGAEQEAAYAGVNGAGFNDNLVETDNCPAGPAYYYDWAPDFAYYGPGGDDGGGGGDSASQQAPPPPQCPLVGIIGNYTPTDAWPVNVEFAPTMAAALDEALSILNTEGIIPQINSGYRGTTTQASIPTNNPYPVAAPGQSWHNVGLAIDIQLNPTTLVGKEIIGAMETAGLTWGGTFTSKDNVHFQLPSAINHGKGRVTSGAPTAAQVSACETEHPLGY